VVDVMIEADRENRENETDVDWLFVADAVLRVIVPSGSVVVKREEIEAAATWIEGAGSCRTLEDAAARVRFLARQEDTQT
jgi:hypothetical protein